MLVSFSVANYRSFGVEETLNMVASNRLVDHPAHHVRIGTTGKHVLRTAVIYGANAAGKSNLVRAMSVAQRLILSTSDQPPAIEPFQFEEEKTRQPSSFEFRFLLANRIYVYGFDVTSKEIVGEWLTVLKDDDELPIYERGQDGVTRIEEKTRRLFTHDTTMFETLGVLSKLPLKGNQLFLSRIGDLPLTSQGETLAAVVRWLTQDLVILEAQYRTNDTLKRLFSDPAFRLFATSFLQNIGTGVEALAVDESIRKATAIERAFGAVQGGIGLFGVLESNPLLSRWIGRPSDTSIRAKPDSPDEIVEQKLVAVHNARSGTFRLPFSDESDGTQQLLHFMPVLSPSEPNKVFVIDELDRSLHPLICWEFVRLFSELLPGARKQLIVTTHEAHLLNQDLLRRDEYWFVEKDSSQQSRLVSLSDFNIRNDLQIQKGYLQGRFGAIPIIGSTNGLERLLTQPGSKVIHAAQETPA